MLTWKISVAGIGEHRHLRLPFSTDFDSAQVIPVYWTKVQYTALPPPCIVTLKERISTRSNDHENVSIFTIDIRRGGSGHRAGSLHLPLSADFDGHNAQAAHQSRPEDQSFGRTGQCVHPSPRISASRCTGGGASELRYALFERLAGPNGRACRRLNGGYRRTLLHVADA